MSNKDEKLNETENIFKKINDLAKEKSSEESKEK